LQSVTIALVRALALSGAAVVGALHLVSARILRSVWRLGYRTIPEHAAVGGELVVARAHASSVLDARRVRQLEKELRRKDKALAETAALLVLQKKGRAIWGDGDDDTKPGSDD
jgi:hypothetical protein